MVYEYRHADEANAKKGEAGMGGLFSNPVSLAASFYESSIEFLKLKNNLSTLTAPISGNEFLIGPSILDSSVLVGNQKLYNDFLILRDQIKDMPIEDVYQISDDSEFKNKNMSAGDLTARSILGSFVSKQRDRKSFSDGEELNHSINVKKDILRPIQLGLSVLSMQLGIRQTNTLDRISEMEKRRLITNYEAKKIKNIYLNAYKSRLLLSSKFKAEFDDVVVGSSKLNEIKEKIKLMKVNYRELCVEESAILMKRNLGTDDYQDLSHLHERQKGYINEITDLENLEKKILDFQGRSFRLNEEVDLELIHESFMVAGVLVGLIRKYVGANCSLDALVDPVLTESLQMDSPQHIFD